MSRIDSRFFFRGLLEALDPDVGSRLPDPALAKLTADTVAAARVPAGVHFAFRGNAVALDVEVRVGSRTSVPAPTVPEGFVARAGSSAVCTPLGGESGVVRIALPERASAEVVRVYLPEAVEVRLGEMEAIGGTIEPLSGGPKLVVYGDSISQGWSVTGQGLAWPSLVAEQLGLEVVNLGFAGSARGELVAADVVGASRADIVVLAWGTNAWSSLPTDDREIAERMRVFLTAVRQGLPEAPIIVVSPIVRPAAESVPNRFGTTHARLREALEESVATFVDEHSDRQIILVSGRDAVPAEQLVDGLHPGDAGHASLAAAIIPYIAQAMKWMKVATHV